METLKVADYDSSIVKAGGPPEGEKEAAVAIEVAEATKINFVDFAASLYDEYAKALIKQDEILITTLLHEVGEAGTAVADAVAASDLV